MIDYSKDDRDQWSLSKYEYSFLAKQKKNKKKTCYEYVSNFRICNLTRFLTVDVDFGFYVYEKTVGKCANERYTTYKNSYEKQISSIFRKFAMMMKSRNYAEAVLFVFDERIF